MDKPTVPEVLPLVNKYYSMGNSCGGNLHIVIEEGNVNDGDVIFCREAAKQANDKAGVEIADLLLRMSKTQRGKICNLSGEER